MSDALRGGRGQLRDDAAQKESYDARARIAQKLHAWHVSSVPVEAALVNCQPLTANLVRFFYLGTFNQNLDLAQARLTITAASAGSTVRTGLYIYDTTVDRRLVLVAPSAALFSGAATGALTYNLGTLVTLSAGSRVFLGVKPSDNVVGVAGADFSTYARTLPYFTLAHVAGVLPPIVQRAAMTENSTGYILAATYLNKEALDVF